MTEAEAEADADARRRIADAAIVSCVYEQADARGLIDPPAVVKLIDRDLLVFDDIGHPLNVLEALDALLDDSPYLIGEPWATLNRPSTPQRQFKPMRISSIPRLGDQSLSRRRERLLRRG
jgi:hypothetical protein